MKGEYKGDEGIPKSALRFNASSSRKDRNSVEVPHTIKAARGQTKCCSSCTGHKGGYKTQKCSPQGSNLPEERKKAREEDE